ncbi:starch phosphorylase [Carboxydocella sporoproducens DSM 16521]|uniref:glycogen phosphorylase n=3 Tax=Carboxydocella TaxID=178898 RepID=A0A1T4Q0L5_9FIRM|nr:starch phosphorylase [Carboxydocella thermautotrophica]SJZ97335.1 starch phosphorylase [Carboxydocella sporoproducens DSM 16521]
MQYQQQKTLPRVAYFCMEYGLHPQLPIYAGGLGILAGDYLKAARDMGLPVVGIGILWAQDYTEQYIGADGRPYDVFPTYDYSFLQDTGVTVTVNVRGEEVVCRIKKVDQYGNAPLYLLDTNYPGSRHGWITSKLYGGSNQDRVAQEIVLGIGGVRALRALGIEVDIYHFNEGHAVFAGLELVREKMAQGLSFQEAWRAARRQIVFTTHTPVPAGNEIHDHGLLQYMGAYNGLTYEQMKMIGGDPFGMTVAGLRLSCIANGVSRIHGEVARRMWKEVSNSAPIISVTNGVHDRTWQDPAIWDAYQKGQSLWPAHQAAKQRLIDFIRQRTGTPLNPSALLVGFARRAAPYKRSDLIFRNTSLIEPLLLNGKLQLVFSGKAHPADEHGKNIIADLVKMDRRFGDAVVFLENYNMEVAKYLVQGCDVWLNNPRRPLEASGTSGMKAAMNGVLNLSVVDGWVAEGPQHGISGWLLDHVIEKNAAHWDQDAEDLKALYHILVNEVIPTYYEDKDRWGRMMRASIEMSREKFSAHRMIREYYEQLYSKGGRDPERRTFIHITSEGMDVFQSVLPEAAH